MTNVAAGVVSATSTNAVNGSQLFLAETATKNTGSSIATIIGGGTKIGGMISVEDDETLGTLLTKA